MEFLSQDVLKKDFIEKTKKVPLIIDDMFVIRPLNDFASIPVELCTYAIKEHKINQVRLFVYLKTFSTGKIILSSGNVALICKVLNLKSKKTFFCHFDWLVSQGWIVKNANQESYIVINYVRLSGRLNFKSAKGAIYEPLDFKKFEGFLAAVVITNYMKRKRRSDKRSGRLFRRPRNIRISSSLSYNLPINYLAKVLDMPKSSVSLLFKTAADSGRIVIEKSYSALGLPIDEKDFIKEYSDYDPNKIVIKSNQLFLQKPSLIISTICFRAKRSLRKFLKEKEKS